ncbi:c-type cytochrome [Roseovarius ramblicola]|uniref:C-type cytochrome n=1 Tax=Roseovarius ramblicola TaxID=2022336 RepID=A0ABV5HY45_9RHOB
MTMGPVSNKGFARLAALATGVGMVAATASLAADEGSIARGGKLYDKWYKVTKQEAPAESHKLYPADAKYAEKAKSNWRCKECHGWDGMGADGAYSSGKHYTGIKGINGMKGGDPAAVVALLAAPEHGFGEYLYDEDLTDLANFVVHGQSDYANYITDGKIVGDVENGRQIYNTVCANCHGVDGKEPKEMPMLGSLTGNPWELMHKVLNGQPGEAMPALRALDHQIAADVIAYIDAELPDQ